MKLNIKKLVKQLGIIFSVALVLTLIFSHVLLVEAIVVSAILAVIGMVVGHTACWLFRWKRLKWILVGLGCLLALSVVVLVEENIRTKHNWNVHRSVLQQKGENFNLSHFVPPTIPDDQNFTMTPLLKPIMEFKHTKNGVVWLDTNASAKVSNLRSELQSKGITNNSKAGSIERGTFADLKTYQEFYKGNTNYYQPTTPGPAGEDILIALSKFDSELNELKEAMKTRPLAKWNVRYTDGDSVFAILLPHLGHIKGLVVFCQIHGIAAADAGLSQMALEDFLVALRLSDSLKNTPILIDHLVRVASLSITIQGIRDGLYRHTWNSEQLLEIEKRLASIDLLSELLVSLRGERASTVLGMEQIRTGHTYIPTANGELRWPWLKLNRVVSCVFYQNTLTMSKLHQEVIDTIVDEKNHRIYTNKTTGFKVLGSERRSPYNVFAKLLMPAYERVGIKTARAQTMVELARTACALERHRLSNGSYPESMTNGLSDIMSGKPIQYRRTADGGYIMYSVGWNGVDDGGVTGFKKIQGNAKETPDAETGDWVWFMPMK